VRGVITTQTPYFGSPIANAVLADPALRKFADRLLQALGGTLESLMSLETAQRAAYYREHAADIKELTAEVPYITFGSWKNDEPARIDTVLEPLRNAMLKTGLDNDGLVPVKSALLPGADHIAVEGLDHLVTVMGEGHILELDRGAFVRTLLLMMIRP
jgi:hypothetical protein